MNTLLRTSLLTLMILLLPACGGGGSSTSSSGSDSRGSNNVQPEQPDDGTGNETPETPPPVASDLTTNVFFPVFDSMALYYDADTDPAVLGETFDISGVSVYPLEHPDERVEYITSTTHEVGLQRLHLKLIESTTPVFLDIDLNNVRTILGNQTSYSSSGTANVSLTGIGSYPVPVTLKASRVGNELIDVAGWPAQPARQIRLELRFTVNSVARFLILQAYPWAEPLLDSITLDLYFVPGVGIARIQQGEMKSSLNRVDGIPQPHVFSVLRNANVDAMAPLQMEVNGEVLTDSAWQSTVYYRTTGEDWLNVEFDETGSWRARLSRSNLERGVYAATVRFTRGEDVQDTTVSLLVR